MVLQSQVTEWAAESAGGRREGRGGGGLGRVESDVTPGTSPVAKQAV